MPSLPLNFAVPALESLDPTILQALVVFAFVFLAILLFGFSRHYIISESLRGLWAGLAIGVVGILIIEGALLWGIKSFVFGEKVATLPANIRQLVLGGREEVTRVLGIEAQRPRPSAQTVVSDFGLLSPLDAELVKNSLCRSD